MLKRDFHIVLVGEVMVETWGRIKRHSSLNSSVKVQELYQFLGGMAINSAIPLASMDCFCELISYIGRNVSADQIHNLKKWTVSLDYCQVISNDSPIVFAFYNKKGYHYYYCPGLEPERLTIPQDLIDQSDMILFAGSNHACFHNLYKSISLVTPRDKIMFSPSYGLYSFPSKILRDLIASSKIFVLNRHETKWLNSKFSMNEKKILELGPDIFIHTQDVDGCTVYTRQEVFHVNALPSNVINPIGAGDAFNAGFLLAYLSHLPLQVCAQVGTIVASLSLNHPETYVAVNTQELESLWNKYYS